ncbi:MAG: hypothetical protein QW101_01680 [Ignisphaera sp.]|uniref:Uncharacterized protein n=1 Tax=Ignisphaera aggregans TaxID=334771 RepID=A0A7J3MZI6_9CREN
MKIDEVTRFLNILDSMNILISSYIVEQKILDLSSLNSRYYIALHDVLLPIAIKDREDGIPKVPLIPYTTIYIHEQKIYAVIKSYFLYRKFSNNFWTHIPAIDLTSNENLLILVSSALAHKIVLSPSERNIVRIMPSNIRTYIDVALKIIENFNDKSLRELKIDDNQVLNIVEFILWLNESKDDNLKEVRYLKGITMRIFKLIYNDHEIDLKSSTAFSPRFIARLISIIPSTVLLAIVNNVETAYRIALTSSLLGK